MQSLADLMNIQGASPAGPPALPLPDPAGFALPVNDMAAAAGGLPEEALRYRMADPFGASPLPPELQMLFDEFRRKERGSLAEPAPEAEALPSPLLMGPETQGMI